MKTEEIAENAREYAEQINRLSDAHSDNTICPITPKELKRCTAEDFIKGYEACNAVWQEKTRMIPVEERLPEEYKNGMSKDVLALAGSKFSIKRYDHQLGIWSGSKNITVTNWREIIE